MAAWIADMMTIAPKDFDQGGILEIPNYRQSSNIDQISRRVQRTATLDGSIEIVDHGFSHGDRTFTLSIPRISKEMAARLQEFVELYTTVYFGIDHGYYEVVPESFRLNGPDGSFRMLVVQQLADV